MVATLRKRVVEVQVASVLGLCGLQLSLDVTSSKEPSWPLFVLSPVRLG